MSNFSKSLALAAKVEELGRGERRLGQDVRVCHSQVIRKFVLGIDAWARGLLSAKSH